MSTEVTLEQASPGLFMFNNTLHLKTEYKTDKGEIEAYVGASGEFFWGGVDNYPDRAKLIVREVDADVVAAALHSPAVAAALEKSASDDAHIAALEATLNGLADLWPAAPASFGTTKEWKAGFVAGLEAFRASIRRTIDELARPAP